MTLRTQPTNQPVTPTDTTAQAFLNEMDARLWKSADRLRQQLDAANYKHIVLGLIFLKYVSDTFAEHRAKLLTDFTSPAHDFYLPSDDMAQSD